MIVPDAPPLPKDFGTSPMVHKPKRAAQKFEQSLDSSSDRTTVIKGQEPITVGPKRLPDSPFPKRLSPTPYHRPGSPYRKVDLPCTDELVPETLGAGILDKVDDSFEVDSESERTLTEEPKTPKVEKNISETPEGITKRKLAPTILPFTDKGTKSKIESKAIVKLKKIDLETKTDIEKRPPINPKKLEGKGPERKVEKFEKPEGSPGKGPMKKAKETERPHKRPIREVVMAPPSPPAPLALPAPIVRSPVRTPSPVSTPPSSTPSSPVSPVVVGPVAMGTVEEIKNALIESNRVAAMPIPQFYRQERGETRGSYHESRRLFSKL